jgi:hypothetical protein
MQRQLSPGADMSFLTPSAARGQKWMLLQTRNCDVLDGHVIVTSIAE